MLKGDLDNFKKKGKSAPLPKECVQLSIDMVLESSLINGEPVNKSDFPGLELIEELNLKNKKLSKISRNGKFNPFNLKSLVKLDLSDNYISSVMSLESCFNLEWLDISNNRISDFSNLQFCPKLKTLLANKN